MGQVFRARDTKLDRDVAIKILPEAFAHDADRLARFTREAKTLASLSHPHIAALRQSWRVGPPDAVLGAPKRSPFDTELADPRRDRDAVVAMLGSSRLLIPTLFEGRSLPAGRLQMQRKCAIAGA